MYCEVISMELLIGIAIIVGYIILKVMANKIKKII